MNCKRFLIASLVVFVAFLAVEYVANRVVLMSTYESLQHLWRPDMESKTWIVLPVLLLMSLMFTYIFIKGREGKGIMEGVRYGVVIWLFVAVPMSHSFYIMIDMPYSLALQWCLIGLIEMLVAGILVAAIYKPPAPKVAA